MTLRTEVILIAVFMISTFALGALTEHHYTKPQIQLVNVDHAVIHNNIVTVTHTIHEKDGTIDSTTTTTDHTQSVQTNEIAKPLPNWFLGATYGTDIHTLQPVYGGQVGYRLFGPVFLNGGLNTRGMVNIGLGFEF